MQVMTHVLMKLPILMMNQMLKLKMTVSQLEEWIPRLNKKWSMKMKILATAPKMQECPPKTQECAGVVGNKSQGRILYKP